VPENPNGKHSRHIILDLKNFSLLRLRYNPEHRTPAVETRWPSSGSAVQDIIGVKQCRRGLSAYLRTPERVIRMRSLCEREQDAVAVTASLRSGSIQGSATAVRAATGCSPLRLLNLVSTCSSPEGLIEKTVPQTLGLHPFPPYCVVPYRMPLTAIKGATGCDPYDGIFIGPHWVATGLIIRLPSCRLRGIYKAIDLKRIRFSTSRCPRHTKGYGDNS
jgi:hypothetical protein